MKKFSLPFVLALALASVPAMAAEGYSLKCDAGGFEAPMTIEVCGAAASAHVSWDGPGSAIFDGDYKDLAIIDLNHELTITQPIVAHAGERAQPGFHVTLRTGRDGRLHGKLHVDSTDGDSMSFDGAVTCLRARQTTTCR
jgi:hypothetical protein